MGVYDDLVGALGKIQSDDDTLAFFQRFDIRKMGGADDGPFFGTWEGRAGDLCIRVKLRWYDPSSPFSIQPDVHVVEVSIYDDDSALIKTITHKYDDRY